MSTARRKGAPGKADMKPRVVHRQNVNRNAPLDQRDAYFQCRSCELTKPAHDYYWWYPKDGSSPRRKGRCRSCVSATMRSRYADNAAKVRRQRRATRVGIDVDRLAELEMEQDGRCAICNTRAALYRGYTTGLFIDHDHACCSGEQACGRCVRGLLCGPCNTGIGWFRDDVETLRSAVQYLERWADR